jgi:hypothetical protein
MAKPVEFAGAGIACTAEIEKLDRDKVYGWVDTRVFDGQGAVCVTASLLDDGKTLIPAGGFALKLLSSEGHEVARKDLIAKNAQGQLLDQIPSVFDRPVVLRNDATLQDYLNLQVKVVYQLKLETGKEALLAALATQFLSFDFNYRAGYETDTGYLIAADNQIFAVIGKPAEFEFIKLETPVLLDTDDASEDEESLDFGML